MKKFSMFLVVLCVATSALAEGQASRFPVRAGVVTIDDGSNHFIILTDNKVGSVPTYCESGSSFGLIQTEMKIVNQGGGSSIKTNPSGCWLTVQPGSTKTQIRFRYFNLAEAKVKEFMIDPARMSRMIYEWRTEKLFPVQ